MPNIRLCKMTKFLCREFHKGFTYDPEMFMDMSRFSKYHYSEEQADAHWQRQHDLERMHLAVLLDDRVIGEVVLKNINPEKKSCTLGIHIMNDTFKNKGYGTAAEILTLQYAFDELGMETVYADAVKKNKRSQHVLIKVGFTESHQDDTFHYYRCDKHLWQLPEL